MIKEIKFALEQDHKRGSESFDILSVSEPSEILLPGDIQVTVDYSNGESDQVAIDHPFMHELIGGLDHVQYAVFEMELYNVLRRKNIEVIPRNTVIASVETLLESYWVAFAQKTIGQRN